MTNRYHTPHTVSAIAVIDLASELIQAGLLSLDQVRTDFTEIEALLASYMGNAEELAIEEQRLPEELMIRLWQIADRHPESGGIGLIIGQRINDRARGFLSNWLSQSATLAEAGDLFCRNVGLLNPAESWQMETSSTSLVFRIGFTSTAYPDLACERSMAALVSWAGYLSRQDIPVLRAGFCRPEPIDLEPYRQVFGNRLLFSQTSHFVELDAAVADYPIPHASSYLKKVLTQKARQLKNQLGSSHGQRVRNLIRRDPLRYGQIEAVCDALHMSRSTLYRVLRQESTSYREILDEVRAEMAAQLKAEGEKDSVIAELIGFRDTASYYRARKRWEAGA